MIATLIVATGMPQYTTAETSERVDLLIHLASGADRSPVRTFAQQEAAEIHYEYNLVPEWISLRGVPVDAIDDLGQLPGVVSVQTDRIVYADLHDSVPHIGGLQAQINAIGLPATGAGARICIVDTGIRPDHIMYSDRIDTAAGYDFVNNDSDPADDHGHGTSMAGIAAGRTGLTVNFFGGSGVEPFQGMAPEATLISIKALNQYGGGFSSDVIAAIEHCSSATLPGGPAHVINLSLGAGQIAAVCDQDPLAAAANAAVDAGIVVVASAGNDGFDDALQTPACGSKVIAVGATYDDPFPNGDFPFFSSFTFCTWLIGATCLAECTDDQPLADDVACYSNQSAMIDVAAPGSFIWSADAFNDPNDIVGGHGTSQAAAHVTGLAALLLDSNPLLSPAEVRQLIRDGAVDVGPPGFDNASGYGRIDVRHSLILASGGQCTTDAQCDDGLFCNGAEFCLNTICEAGATPCAGRYCRESDDACVNCLGASDCDDDNPCNGMEICQTSGDCAFGPIEDCNGNEVLDACDIESASSLDCQPNTIPDECELANGSAGDVNGNGTPDECDPPPVPPLADLSTPTRNRYIAFRPSNGDNPVAYGVSLTASNYFPTSVGFLGWVSEPVDPGCPDSCGGDHVARVVAEPVFRVWTEPVVHVGDCEIVPVALYEISATVDLAEFSTPLAVGTTPRPLIGYWADCVGPKTNGVWTDPDGYINFDDITAGVFAFQKVPGYTWPSVMRVDVHGNESGNVAIDPPNYVANLADLQFMVQAFQGWGYPFSAPADCP